MDICIVKGNQFQLNTKNTSYVMHNENGLLCHTYYGKRLPDVDHGYMVKRNAYNSDIQSNISENVPTLDNALLEYPAFGEGGIVSPSIEVLNADGTNFVDLRFVDFIIHNDKPQIEGLPASYMEDGDNVQTLEIKTKDSVSGVEASLFYAVFYDYDVITRWVKITNKGENGITLLKALSGNIAFDNKKYDVISNFGTWARERQIERAPLLHTGAVVESNCGSSSHYANPFMIMAEHNASEDKGEAVGIALAYSGNHKTSAFLSKYNVVNLSGGISPDNFRWNLNVGESFSTPELVISFSDSGLNTLSQNFHTLIKNRVCRGVYRDKKRPVLLNLWEACYFDFTDETIKKAADSAADLGVELLVIDDGWFGKRNSDRSSLGDWFVNEEKIKCGLAELCKYVNSKGLMLGIWFEPEMISPDSDLFKKHPEWVMQIKGRKPTESRWQLMLDLTNPEVQDFVYDSIANVLKNTNIEYIKWDYNRTMAHIGSTYLKSEQMGEYYHRYILGLYDVLERITTKFPDVLFEGCSGGGGRNDPGILHYMPQNWASDDTDATERLYIQYGASMVYPASTVGSHVSAVPNHQVGRISSLSTRGTVAMNGAFGYELDLSLSTPEELEEMKKQVEFYKENREIVMTGNYYRLKNPFTSRHSAWMYVSQDTKKALVYYVVKTARPSNEAVLLKLRGLDKNAEYEINGKVYSAKTLMNHGILFDSKEKDGDNVILVLTKR